MSSDSVVSACLVHMSRTGASPVKITNWEPGSLRRSAHSKTITACSRGVNLEGGLQHPVLSLRMQKWGRTPGRMTPDFRDIYICIQIRMQVHIRMHVHACTHTCLHTRMNASLHTFIHTCIPANLHICIPICLWSHSCDLTSENHESSSTVAQRRRSSKAGSTSSHESPLATSIMQNSAFLQVHSGQAEKNWASFEEVHCWR